MSARERPAFVISAALPSLRQSLADVWLCREALYLLGWRDVQLRYRQTLFGAAWALIQPLANLALFILIFHRMIGIASSDLPYPVFAYAGLLPWLLFQNSLLQAAHSVVAEARIVAKAYFPRLIIPLAASASAWMDFLISFLLLLGLMAAYGLVWHWPILLVPLWALLAAFAALGFGIWLAGLNVRYRDVQHVLPLLVRLWMFLSPVAYPLGDLQTKALPAAPWVFDLNPLSGVIEGFRWSLCAPSAMPFPWRTVLLGTAVAAVSFVTGVRYFQRAEREFADWL